MQCSKGSRVGFEVDGVIYAGVVVDIDSDIPRGGNEVRITLAADRPEGELGATESRYTPPVIDIPGVTR